MKHVKETKIAHYASNLKIALRKVYGIESPHKIQMNRPRIYPHNRDNVRLDNGLKRKLLEKILEFSPVDCVDLFDGLFFCVSAGTLLFYIYLRPTNF